MTERTDFEVPVGALPSRCRSCGAAVVWIVTGERSDGSPKRMPLDLASAEVGLDGVRRCESHFARCPDAAKWRRKR